MKGMSWGHLLLSFWLVEHIRIFGWGEGEEANLMSVETKKLPDVLYCQTPSSFPWQIEVVAPVMTAHGTVLLLPHTEDCFVCSPLQY